MDVAVIGESLIDFIPRGDGVYHAHAGGSPFNVALSLGRQGANVSYLCPLSSDPFGDQLFDALAHAGVALPTPARSARPTSLAIVHSLASGGPDYTLYRAGVADTDVDTDTLRARIPAQTRVLHTGSLALAPGFLETLLPLLSEMGDRATLVSIDINIRLRACPDTERYLGGVRRALPFADILKASDEDLAALFPDLTPIEAARQALAASRGGVCLLTLGPDGVIAVRRDDETRVPGVAVEVMGDTVGAGDTFHSAFLAELIRTQSAGTDLRHMDADTLRRIVHFGAVAAAINVSRVGCSPPTHREVLDQLHAMGGGPPINDTKTL